MGVGAHTAAANAGRDATPRLRRLLPPGEDTDPHAYAESLDLAAAVPREVAPPRPRVLLNMVSTADGRASLDGRSAPMSNAADRLLFHALRGVVDAVLVGAGTLRAERYGRIVRDPESRRRRAQRGLQEDPLACVASARLLLDPDIPLLADAASRIAILTPLSAMLPDTAARVEYVRAERDGELDLPNALAQLHERFSVRTLLCEGGPHLNHDLLLAGLVDELFLSIAPKLAGGDDLEHRTLRILAGAELEQPAGLELVSALESESQLFLHYRVRASAPAGAS